MATFRTYDQICDWRLELNEPAHALLGNGFSMAYDPTTFSYAALAKQAQDKSHLSDPVVALMAALGTSDFEATMRTLNSAIATLNALDPAAHASTTEYLKHVVDELREALARSIAGLHPERPYDIHVDRYRSVRRFLAPFTRIYTVNYDLLFYWALMQEVPDNGVVHQSRAHDDGFRDSGELDDETVLWDLYDPHKQTVYYLHGAMHLYLAPDGLRKLTWVRTDEALVDQTRAQLHVDRFPLYVAESDSSSKLDRINRSAYLSKGLRSLAAISGSLTVYGHSLDPNDDHVYEAVVRSRVKRMAVSIFGDPDEPRNLAIVQRAEDLADRRAGIAGRPELELCFYQAEDVELWQPVAV